jgi:ribosomal protein S18 acetylase RimI-like enzyme
VRIRPAVRSDREFILNLAPRLTEFGDVPGRDAASMAQRDRDVLAQTLEDRPPATEIFVAEDDDGTRVGFIHLTTADDYYSASTTAHVADIVVVSEAGGAGVGTALLAHAEAWARERGFALLTLNVFAANERARRLYTRVGFHEEWIRCIKRL